MFVHWKSFVAGVLFGAVVIAAAAAAGTTAFLDSVEIVMPIDIDGYVTMIGQELSATVLSALPGALGEMRAEVPSLVSQEMNGMFSGATLDIGGWQVRIPAETLADLDAGMQEVVRECIYSVLDDIDPGRIAANLRSECETRLKTAAAEMLAWDMYVSVAGRYSVPLRFSSGDGSTVVRLERRERPVSADND